MYLFFMCLLNLYISFSNAKNVGLVWCESKAIGGFIRLLVWCGAIQSAIGFTSVYMVIFVLVAYQIGYFSSNDMLLFLNFTYVLIIIPAIGSGLLIMISSWIRLYRERSLASLGLAGWNTFAQFRNMYHAYNAFGPALKSIGKSIPGRNSRNKNAGVILLAILVILLGVITTTVIVRRYAGTLDLPENLQGRLKEA